MKQNLFVVSSDEIAMLTFNSDDSSFKKICFLPVNERAVFLLSCKELLFVAYETRIASYSVEYTEFRELSSVLCDGFTPYHLEYIPSSGTLLVAGGEGGKNAVYSVVDGRLIPCPHIFTHSYTDKNEITHLGGFASCNKATNNPYRIASLDRENGIAVINNLFSQNGISVRECSRINVGAEKGIDDIVFTDMDIAYILCKNSGEIIFTDFHSGSGSLWPLRLLPITANFSNPQIHLSNDSKKLFVLNAKEDNVFILNLNSFSVKDITKFTLTEKAINFCISSDGKFIFVSHRNKIAVYSSCSFRTLSEFDNVNAHIIIT